MGEHLRYPEVGNVNQPMRSILGTPRGDTIYGEYGRYVEVFYLRYWKIIVNKLISEIS